MFISENYIELLETISKKELKNIEKNRIRSYLPHRIAGGQWEEGFSGDWAGQGQYSDRVITTHTTLTCWELQGGLAGEAVGGILGNIPEKLKRLAVFKRTGFEECKRLTGISTKKCEVKLLEKIIGEYKKIRSKGDLKQKIMIDSRIKSDVERLKRLKKVIREYEQDRKTINVTFGLRGGSRI